MIVASSDANLHLTGKRVLKWIGLVLVLILASSGGAWLITLRHAGAASPPASIAAVTPTAPAGTRVVQAVLFWSNTCPHCLQVVNNELPPLQAKYGGQLDIRMFEVSEPAHIELFQSAVLALQVPSEKWAVPFMVIGDRVLVGSDEIPRELPGLVEKHLAAGGVGWPPIPGLELFVGTPVPLPASTPASSPVPPTTVARAGATPTPVNSRATATPAPPAVETPLSSAAVLTPGSDAPAPGSGDVLTLPPAEERHLLDVPLLGQVDLDRHSLAVSTIIIGLVDGFNPCSLWVISLLLALVVNTGSRSKTLLVGLTFLLVAAGVYAVLITGLFSLFAFIGYALWIRIGVAVLALVFAAINIKDYFWFKQGVSLTLPDESKPKLYRDIRSILAADKSVWGLVGATTAMALGVTLLEMPCTAGLPILWTKLISAHEVGAMMFAFLLGLYLVMYVLDELLVFVSAVVTLRAARLEEKQGRILKLVGGVVMLVLAFVLLVDPTLMDSIANSLFVFGVAFATALLILLVHRRVLPRFGVIIGTGIPRE